MGIAVNLEICPYRYYSLYLNNLHVYLRNCSCTGYQGDRLPTQIFRRARVYGCACTKCSKTLNNLSTFKNGQTLMKYTLQKQNFSRSA